MRTKICFCFWIVFLSICVAAKAQKEPTYIKSLIGNSIAVGQRIDVKDSSFFDPVLKPTIKYTYFINNLVSLRINEEVNKIMPDSFSLSVKVKIVYTAPDTLSDSIPEKILTINYNKNKSYDNKAVFYFQSAHFVRVEVLQITSTYADTSQTLPLAILENRMVIQRDYDMSCTNDVINSLLQDTTTISAFGEIKLKWTPNRASQMYDIEWTYLDQSAVDAGNYSTSGHLDPSKIFRNNATRITTKADTCMIPLLYDGEGILVYRIRGAQIDQNGEVQTTKWNSEIDTTSAHWKYHFMGHERGLNWQASITYAEDGKRKSVVQYFDGSLRARQVVTRDNTTQTTVVAETLYDKQGRPVIQVMPAPTLSTLIHYTPSFNVKAMNGAEYDKGVYDTLLSASDYCNIHEDSMSVSSGASQYYSANNPLKDQGFHQFIPDAHKFPFTQTQYTRDNTGRIYAQGGVDNAFTLGSGKETKYYYFAAKQSELDALFGTEVGEASHYQKNMVRDANGQYSVSYVDMHGRTIATALAGKVPQSLDTLSTWRDSVETDQLLTKTNNLVNGNSVDFSTSIFMTREDDVTLHYSMAKQSLSLKDCKDSNVCYSCLYDLTITVSGDCDSCVTGRNDTTIKFSNFPLWRVDSACSLAVPIDTTISLHLKEGGYNITKKLSISQLGMDKYRDSVFMLSNTCSSYDSIYRRQMRLIKDSLSCSAETLNEPTYARYRDIMEMDVYPLTGQYGHYKDTSSTGNCFSVFNKVTGDKYYYQIAADSLRYLNESGGLDSVLNGAGVLVAPQQLSPEEFIANFKDSWLQTLVIEHPEYRRLVTYEKFATSLTYDDDFENTDTYAAAAAKGYLNPTGSSSAPANKFSSSADPLFGYPFLSWTSNAIQDSLFKLIHVSGSEYITAWGLATAMSKCQLLSTGQFDINCVEKWNTSSNVFNTDSLCTGDLDMAWRFFRGIYLKQKRAWIEKYVHDNSGVSDGQLCTPVFFTLDSLLAQGGFTTNGNQSNQNAGADSAHTFYVANCNAYVDQWKEQLGSCYTTTQVNTIISSLLQVCIAGADSLHPFGSSSISPISTNTYKNFQEVFTHYNNLWNSSGAGIDTTTCNAYRIDKPLPYNQPMFVTSQLTYSKPDSCSCARINILYRQYQKYSSSFSSFSDYMQKVHSTSISNANLDSLRHLCNDTLTCKNLATPISIPPALQCGASDVCVNCILFKEAYDNFTVRYPTIVPSIEETDTTQQLKNKLFANYLNNWFGFTKTAQDYLIFKDDCSAAHLLVPDVPDNTSTCANLQKIANRFTYDRLSGLWDVTPPKQYYDSNGCNVTLWATNNGYSGYLHDMQFKVADFLQGGVWKMPSSDSIHAAMALNYAKRWCVNNGFTLAARLRIPRDSARMMQYLRAGGDTNLYGTLIYELGQNGDYYNHSKVFGEISHKVYARRPYIFVFSADPNHSDWQNYYIEDTDSGMVADLANWTVFKISLKNNKIYLYADSVLLKVSDAPYKDLPYPQLKSVGRFSLTTVGYDMQVDWVKFYDENDSLRMTEEFNSCNWTPNPYDSICSLNCTDRFQSIVDGYLGNNATYSQIISQFAACNVPIPACDYTGPTLCGKSEAMNEIVNIPSYLPCQDSTDFAIVATTQLDQIYRDSLLGSFNEAYTKKCLNVSSLESFSISKPVSEYHYTLYYYDQAGNLVKTTPPNAVHPNRGQAFLDSVKLMRDAGLVYAPQTKDSLLQTVYRYNSLNQVVTQKTPDGGLSKFWYDRLGRLAISQNAKQLAATKFSYTRYDAIGRIIEVGEKYNTNGMSQTTSRNEVALKKWIEFKDYDQTYMPRFVTQTGYDNVSEFASIYSGCTPFRQKSTTLRNRVSFTRNFDLLEEVMNVSGTDTTYSPSYLWHANSIEYSYDIHGNVDSMLNIYFNGSIMNNFGCNFVKLIAYKYDLISGKVNEVHYNPGKADEFYHRYVYDAENRLTDVYTADNKAFLEQNGLEDHDAHYEYYKHGPLARVVLGHQQVQGVDYAYTLQGWLKGVNSTSMNPDYDMGLDGNTSSTNKYVARDEYGFNLNYFTGDYFQISGSAAFPGHSGIFADTTNYRPLYNGNISSMAVNIKKLNQPQLYNYKYDQLNRITKMDVFYGLTEGSNQWTALTYDSSYKERIAYDPNGNILKYLRRGIATNPNMDSLNYHYNNNSNQLNYISDNAGFNNYTTDIDNQPANNYHYDEIGNLIYDNLAGINSITWDVYGKIRNISRNPFFGGDYNGVDYKYDPKGDRIGKTYSYNGAVDRNAMFDWYVRDAQGNVMAVYEVIQKKDWSLGPLKLIEHHLYGSSRLGIIRRDQNMDSLKANAVNASLIGNTYLYEQQRGNKLFELTNHLGNVLVTVSDKKFGHVNGSSYDYYNADVVNATDYYPFGMTMPNRSYSATNSYRYGFNGKENDNEVKGEGNEQDYGERVYDTRLGRFLSVDPIADDYPYYSPYHFAGNNPTTAIDMDGLEPAYTYYNSQFNRWVSMPAGDNLQRKNIPDEQRRAIPVGSGPNDGGRGVSVLLNVIPVVNEGKGLYESITGKDVITGEELSITDRLLGLIPYAKVEKGLNKVKTAATVTRTASKTIKAVNKLETPSPNRGTGQALEDVSKREPLKQAYEDAATGAASDVASKKRIVPTLKYDNPNPNGKNFVKFDGFEVESKTLIDRKWNVTTFDKSLSQLKRMSEALKQNPGFKGVIEVPTQKAYNNAVRAVQKAGVTNISVKLVPHNP